MDRTYAIGENSEAVLPSGMPCGHESIHRIPRDAAFTNFVMGNNHQNPREDIPNATSEHQELGSARDPASSSASSLGIHLSSRSDVPSYISRTRNLQSTSRPCRQNGRGPVWFIPRRPIPSEELFENSMYRNRRRSCFPRRQRLSSYRNAPISRERRVSISRIGNCGVSQSEPAQNVCLANPAHVSYFPDNQFVPLSNENPVIQTEALNTAPISEGGEADIPIEEILGNMETSANSFESENAITLDIIPLESSSLYKRGVQSHQRKQLCDTIPRCTTDGVSMPPVAQIPSAEKTIRLQAQILPANAVLRAEEETQPSLAPTQIQCQSSSQIPGKALSQVERGSPRRSARQEPNRRTLRLALINRRFKSTMQQFLSCFRIGRRN